MLPDRTGGILCAWAGYSGEVPVRCLGAKAQNHPCFLDVLPDSCPFWVKWRTKSKVPSSKPRFYFGDGIAQYPRIHGVHGPLVSRDCRHHYRKQLLLPGGFLRKDTLRLLIVAVLFVILAVPSLAGTLYDISFTLTSGPNVPTSGSFTYDPVSGFSAFVVVFDSVAFDLTSAANAPFLTGSTGCNSRASNQQYGFIIMSESATGCTPVYDWLGSIAPLGNGTFGFALSVTPSGDVIEQTRSLLMIPNGAFGNGTFSIAAVPEPSSLGLAAISLGIWAFLLAWKPSGARKRWTQVPPRW